MSEKIEVSPAVTTVADWIKVQNTPFLYACANDAPANLIMDVLRAMEIWAHDRRRDMDTVEIDEIRWVDGKLVVSFR